MSTEQNKTLIRRFVEEVFNQGKLETIDEMVAPHFMRHGTTTLALPGRDSLKQTAALWRRAFADVHSEIDDIVAEGDRVAYRWTISGSHQGEFMGVAGTGQVVTVSGMAFFRIAGGQLVEEWVLTDQLGLRQQLGLIPNDKAKE